jgi:subtilisin family serine protease
MAVKIIISTLVLVMLVLGFGFTHVQANSNYQNGLLINNIYDNDDELTIDTPEIKQGEFIIKFKNQISPERNPVIDEIRSNHGIKNIRQIPGLSNTFRISLSDKAPIDPLVQKFKNHSTIEYIEPNFIRKAVVVPNDPYYLDSYPSNTQFRDTAWWPSYDYLWNLKKINSASAWDITTGRSDTLVAVIDSGVDYTHPELGGCSISQVNGNSCTRVAPGYDYFNFDNDPSDDNGHGTHVAGIISSSTNNGSGISGINWNARIIPIKVLNQWGQGYDSDISSGIVFAADRGAKVINLSLGGFGQSQTMTNAVNYALSRGILVVAAAGNNNADVKYFTPANIAGVMAVSATDENDLKASFSNYGDSVSISAPGTNIISLRAAGTDLYCASGACNQRIINNIYYRASGTSMSSPHVAGAAAIVWSGNTSLSGEAIKNILINSSKDINTPGFDASSGYGRLDLGSALTNMNTSKPPWGEIAVTNFNPQSRVLDIEGQIVGDGSISYYLEYSTNQEDWVRTGIQGNSQRIYGPIGSWTVPQNVDTRSIFIRLYVESTRAILVKSYSTMLFYSYADYTNLHSGWPRAFAGLSLPYFGAEDFNLDGDKEIFLLEDSKMNVIQPDGTNLSGWPQPANGLIYASVAGDISKSNPGLEIVYGEWQSLGKFNIVARNSSGGMLAGFPVNLNYWISGLEDMTLADVNCDGNEDILFPSFELRSDGNYIYKLYAIDGLGMPLAGYPKSFNDYIYSSPGNYQYFIRSGNTTGDVCLETMFGISNALFNATRIYNISSSGTVTSVETSRLIDGRSALMADIDLNGFEDLVFSTANGTVESIRGNQTPIFTYNNQIQQYSSVVAGNLDDSPGLETVILVDSRVVVLNALGTELARWEVPSPYFLLTSEFDIRSFKGVLGDYNNDGKKEISFLAGMPDGVGKIWMTVTYDNGSFTRSTQYEQVIASQGESVGSVEDIDGDGLMELVLSSTAPFGDLQLDGKVWIFDLDSVGGPFYWSRYHFDSGFKSSMFQTSLKSDFDLNEIINAIDIKQGLSNYKYLYKGDVNSDYKVNGLDFGITSGIIGS